MKISSLIVALLISNNLIAQIDSSKKLSFSVYGEFYYSYDFSEPSNHEKSSFLYNHKRHNEFNANLLLLKGSYFEKKYRANMALMAGNYAQYNLSAEPNWAQYIYEASIGLKLSQKRNIWLDVGIFPSHIGFESAISADCWTLTRSLLAENSPYYESGVKASYISVNDRIFISALLLNGWQRIRRPDFIQTPSFGTQTTYRPSAKLSLNYSNFLGTDKADSLNTFRHFHNFYAQYEPSSRFGVIVGFDMGFEKAGGSLFKNWYAPVIIIRQRMGKKTNLALRSEYYSDINQVIIQTGTQNGFQTLGISTNLDYDIHKNFRFRMEGKLFHSKDQLFTNNKSNNNFSLTSNLTFKL